MSETTFTPPAAPAGHHADPGLSTSDTTPPTSPADSTRPRTRTGDRVRQLVGDVKADLSDVGELIRRAREQVGMLEEEGRGINGLTAACRGWGQQLDKMLHDIDEEQTEVERTMLGTRPRISESIDQDLRARIVLARGA